MKLFTLLSVFLFAGNFTIAQSPNKNYDSVLAKKLNADANGMKRYYLVILKTGTAKLLIKLPLTAYLQGT